MPNKPNIIPSDTLGNIDINSTGFKDDGSIRSSIQGAKNLKSAIMGIDQELATTMKDMNSYIKNSEKELAALLSFIDKLGKGYKTAFENSAIFKKATDDLRILSNATKDYQRMVEDQNTSSKDLVNIYNKVTEAYTESSNAISYMTAATWDNNESAKDLKSTLRVLYQQLKDGNQLTKEQLQDLSKYLKELEKSSGSLGERITNFADKTQGILTNLKTIVSLDKLVAGLGPSTEMQLQTQLQQKYNLSRGQFSTFKKSLYGSFDRSLYSADQVIQTMQSLSSMGFRDEKEITKYFDKILKGQQILGMSAENQTALMQLANKTGKDELTLGTNTFAKYFKEITNVSKEQLNQLVSINTNFASQMADLGVSSDAFRSTNEAVTGALTKASGDTNLASLYNQVVGSYANSTDLAAEMIGMSSGQWKNTSIGGVDLISILESGRGRAGNYYRALLSGDYDYQDELSQGMDSATKSLIDQLARLKQEGKLTRDLINKFKGLDGEAIEAELEDIYKANQSDSEKIANYIANTYDMMVDWKLNDSLNNGFSLISNLLLYIASIISLKGSLFGDKGIFSFLAGKGGLKGIAAASGKGVAVGAGLLSAASIAGGALIGLNDANQMSYGKGLDVGDVRGFFLGTGNTEQSSVEKTSSVLGNTAKYALIGAGIGTIIPGVGTAVGAGVGALAGALTGFIGTTMNKTVKEQEKTNDKLDKVVSNTAKTASALTIKESGRSIVSVVPYSSKVSRGSSGRSFGGPVGSAAGLKYSITSGYGQRDDGFHRGIDFSGGNINGAPLYSNVDGTVVDVGKDPAGANFVGVKGSDGYIHYYWHMIAPSMRSVNEKVKQGDLVGYVGSTGYSTGPHLHYQVSRSRYSDGYTAFNNNTVNPWSFATDAIFTGNASYYSPDYGLSDTSLLSSISKNVSNVKLASLGSPSNSSGIISSIVDLKETIVNLSKQTTANEKLMRAITSTYNTQPRFN